MSRYGFQLGLPAYREAAARYLERRFHFKVDPFKELHPLIGSKEGIAHLAMAVLSPGDVAIVPEPGYAVYDGGTVLAGGEAWSTSALALALGKSQRSVQRALSALEETGTVRGIGQARARRWVMTPSAGFATTLLLVGQSTLG